MTLPAGLYLSPRPCPDCGKRAVFFDNVEGLKLFACPDRCRIDAADPAFAPPG
jgi:predicted  nucleic acid-binding Zn ribbon protein